MATINGTNGNDNLIGTVDDDTINAFKRIAPGIDTVDGGAGIDTLVVNASGETDGVQLFAGGSPTFQVRSNTGNFYVDAYNMERVNFTGGAGNDTINTGNHGGSVNGGAGVDYWTANLGAVASDIAFTLGATTAIVAADLTSILNIERIDLTTGVGNDTITGGARADTISTGAGNDTINAGKVLAEGDGDFVSGGADIDTLVVNASSEIDGVQLSSGGSPTFQVRSNSGNFYVDAYDMERVVFTGGAGNDTINTGNHGGSVNGGAGVDFWTADLSAVTSNIAFVLGGTTAIAAADLASILGIERINLTTGSGNDAITGGARADTISAGAGNDMINAGKVLASGDGDLVDGGTGTDTLVVNASSETGGMQLVSGGAPTFQVRSNSGIFHVDAYNMERVNFTGGSGSDTMSTADHGGRVDGGSGVDYWTADLGAVGANIVFTLGTTTAIGAAGLTSILNIERINLSTGAGDDTIVGGALADTLATRAGNDTINAGTVLPGGDGDLVEGGAGIDTLVVNASAETNPTQLISGGSPSYQVRSSSGNFYVDAYNVEKVKFTGGASNDTIDTAAGGSTVDGGPGNDQWLANLSAVASSIVFTLGTTTSIAAAGLTSILNIEQIVLTTGAGADTITGGARADTINTGAGNDTINPGSRIAGSNQADTVVGGLGTDTLIVDASAETEAVQLFSGGIPTFQVRSHSGNFYVNAYDMEKVIFTGGADNDTINTGNHGGKVDGAAGVDYWVADLSAVVANIGFILGTTTAIGAAGLTSILNIEQIDLTTGNGNDNVTGGARADTLSTGAGNDTINAGARIAGTNAVDTVAGGAGVDTLVANLSTETLSVQLFSGGIPTFQVRSNSGNFYVNAYDMERVVFTGGSGNDTINTGNHGGSVNGAGGADHWLADLGAVASNIAFTLGTTTAIAAAGLTSILNIERINLTTGAGDDTITAGALADTISTGAGNDTIDAGARVAGTNAVDTVDGAAGVDTLIVDASAETQGLQLFSGGIPTFQVRSNSGNFHVDAYNMETVDFTAGSGNDLLNGGAGNDLLTGGLGRDTFLFDTALNAATNVDQIFDFSSVDDKVLLSQSVFAEAGGVGTLGANAFFIGASAHDADDRIIYASGSGALRYDPDGIGGVAATQFATLSAGLALTNGNFQIV
jgi:Ca2+-binding RTX toxin-like protein